MPRKILGFDDAETVAQYAAREFVRRARTAVATSGAFKVALAGGATPRRSYELIAQSPLARQIDWEATHIFFGDERSVPPDHSESNFRTAFETLLSKVNIPEAQIHRMEGERSALEQAAADYQEALGRSFDVAWGSGWPRFDLVMLGMGDDGHTASLFPGTAALEEKEAWVVANDVPQKSTRRLTLTAPVLNAAHCIMFTVAGAAKAAPLAAVLEGPRRPDLFPAQWIEPGDGDLLWLVDRGAASRLVHKPDEPTDATGTP